MNNIDSVTSFLKEKVKAKGGDPYKETLTVVKTKDGKNYYKEKVKEYVYDSCDSQINERAF